MIESIEFMMMEILVGVMGSMLTSILLGVDQNKKKKYGVYLVCLLKIVALNVAVNFYKRITGDYSNHDDLLAIVNIVSVFLVVFSFHYISGCSLLHCIYGGVIFEEAILGGIIMLCSYFSYIVREYVPAWKGVCIVAVVEILLVIGWYYLLHVPRLYHFLSKFSTYQFKFKWIWYGIFLLLVGSSFSAYVSALKVSIHEAVEQTAYVVISLFLICELYWMFYIMKERSVRQDYQILVKENMVMKEYYDTLKRQMDVTRRFRHDIAKHMNIIEELGSTYQSDQMIQEYISHFEEQYKELQPISYCGELIVDAILFNKKKQCEEKGIDFKIEMQNFQSESMQDMDVTVLLVNLIDDAIESCLKMEDEKQRKIWLKSVRQGKNQFLQMIQKYSEKELDKVEKEKFLCQKKNAHMKGIEIIHDIVNKYDGNMEYEIDREKQEMEILVQWS